MIIAAIAAGVFAVLNVGLVVLNARSGGPQGPTSSSYAVGPSGLSGYASLLRHAGHRIERLRTPLGIEEPAASATVVLLDATQLQSDDAAALSDFVDAGGRLIVGGRTSGAWLGALLGSNVALGPVGPIACRPAIAAPETAGVSEVESDGKGGFTDAGATEPILGCGNEILATVASPGSGRVVFLADAAVLDNRLLAVRDNAAFGLDIAGPSNRPVSFVEYVHGFHAPRGLAALPLRAKVALVGLALAACLALLARLSRPGPANDHRGDTAPSRGQHVHAVSALLARAGTAHSRADLVRGAARRAVRTAAGLSVDATDADVRAAAEQLGIPPDEVAAIVGHGGGPDDIIRAGRVLARANAGGRVPPPW